MTETVDAAMTDYDAHEQRLREIVRVRHGQAGNIRYHPFDDDLDALLAFVRMRATAEAAGHGQEDGCWCVGCKAQYELDRLVAQEV